MPIYAGFDSRAINCCVQPERSGCRPAAWGCAASSNSALSHFTAPVEIFASVCQGDGYDVAEMSLAAHLHRCGHGDDYVGIPVFTSRAFRHGMVCIRATATSRVGGSQWQTYRGARMGMTALVWLIGILTDGHGFDMTTVSWCSLREPRIDVKPPAPIALLPPETCVHTTW